MNRKQRRAAKKQHRGASVSQALAKSAPVAEFWSDAVSHYSSGRLAEAERLCRHVLAIDPNHVDGLHLFGLIAHQTGRSHDALRLLSRAIELNSGNPVFHNSAAGILHWLGSYDMALEHCRKAIALSPNFASAHLNLGVLLTDAHAARHPRGDLREAISSVRRALTLKPDLISAQLHLAYLRAHTCDWREYDRESAQILRLVREDTPVDPFVLLSRPSTAADQLRCARNWSRRFAVERSARFRHDSRLRSPKIRLGYLSEDFREHPTASLIAELIELHDRERFEVKAYSYGADDGSDKRRRLKAAFDCFTDLFGTDDGNAARRINADNVDILIDVQGYTGRQRARILALRPAPIQVSYLAYPGTLGANYTDYILVDRFVVPTSEQDWFSEKLVQLPNCYQPSDTTRPVNSSVPPRASCNLPEDGFVFCCFNNSFKLTPEIFGIWMHLLRAVPHSVLWLLESNSLVAENLRREAVRRQVAPERLVFAPRVTSCEHLARHQLADLFLDTLPYNAHTGASDALWAGLPVLTCGGATFPGRVAGSLLRAIGLPELISTSITDYEDRALRLAREPARLGEIRRRLAENRSRMPLFRMGRYVRGIETAFRQIWEQWCKGEQPASLIIQEGN